MIISQLNVLFKSEYITVYGRKNCDYVFTLNKKEGSLYSSNARGISTDWTKLNQVISHKEPHSLYGTELEDTLLHWDYDLKEDLIFNFKLKKKNIIISNYETQRFLTPCCSEFCPLEFIPFLAKEFNHNLNKVNISDYLNIRDNQITGPFNNSQFLIKDFSIEKDTYISISLENNNRTLNYSLTPLKYYIVEAPVENHEYSLDELFDLFFLEYALICVSLKKYPKVTHFDTLIDYIKNFSPKIRIIK